jgi:hypothetical protein
MRQNGTRGLQGIARARLGQSATPVTFTIGETRG